MKILKFFLMFVLAISFSLSSCRPKHAKQVVKAVDDYVDDVARKGVKVKRNPIKQCRDCNGTGQVYYQGYWYECPNCHGTGKVIIQ